MLIELVAQPTCSLLQYNMIKLNLPDCKNDQYDGLYKMIRVG